eukprot:scaffold24040_cov131-Isochrysis_galbana.AAC.1
MHFNGAKGAAHLNRVDIGRNDDELGLLLLTQLGDVVDAALQEDGLLRLIFHTRLLLLSQALQALFLLSLRLWTVLVQQLEHVDRHILIQAVGELVDRRRHLQALVQDLALALDPYVLGPAHVAAQVALRLDVTTNGEVLLFRLKHRPRWDVLGLLLRVGIWRRRRGLLRLGSLRHGCADSAHRGAGKSERAAEHYDMAQRHDTVHGSDMALPSHEALRLLYCSRATPHTYARAAWRRTC